MRALDLNLASRPFRNNSLLWLGHGLLAAGVVGFTAWNTVTFVETGTTLDVQRNTVGSLADRKEEVANRETRVQKEIGRHNLKLLTAETTRANDVIQRKAMSWTRLFTLLEKTQPYEVKMESVRPMFGGAGRRSATPAVNTPESIPVSVDGTAKDLRAFLEFERALIRDPHFDRVEPERTTHSKGGEVLFSLTFLYFPEDNGRGEAAPDTADAGEDAGSEFGETPEENEAEAAGASPSPRGATSQVGTTPLTNPPPTAQPLLPPAANAAAATAPKPKPAASEASVAAPSNVAAPSENKEAETPSESPMERYARERKEPPSGPIRKRPAGWQPPDPFGKEKDKKASDAKPAPSSGDRK